MYIWIQSSRNIFSSSSPAGIFFRVLFTFFKKNKTKSSSHTSTPSPPSPKISHRKEEMSKMRLREATVADIPRLAEIWSIAFSTDPFYDAIFPRRSEFFDDYRNMWTTKLHKRFLQVGEQYIVVETDIIDTNGRSRSEVTGWASWKRMGSSKTAQKISEDRECILKGVCKSEFGLFLPRRIALM